MNTLSPWSPVTPAARLGLALLLALLLAVLLLELTMLGLSESVPAVLGAGLVVARDAGA